MEIFLARNSLYTEVSLSKSHIANGFMMLLKMKLTYKKKISQIDVFANAQLLVWNETQQET